MKFLLYIIIDSASRVLGDILVLLFPKEMVDKENIVSILALLPIAVQSGSVTLVKFGRAALF